MRYSKPSQGPKTDRGPTIEFPLLQADERLRQLLKGLQHEYIPLRKNCAVKTFQRIFSRSEDYHQREVSPTVRLLGLDVRKLEPNCQKPFGRSKEKLTAITPRLSDYSASDRALSPSLNSRTRGMVPPKKSSTPALSTKQSSFSSKDINRQEGTTSIRQKTYLYMRLAATQIKMRDDSNYIYDRRITSYVDLLWKLQFAHGIQNLNELDCEEQTKIQKRVAYVGPGNNSLMVKGLIKRRFWWTISEKLTAQCDFIWTQTKVNRIFDHQKSVSPSQDSLRQILSTSTIPETPPTQPNPDSKILNQSDLALMELYTSCYEATNRRTMPYRWNKLNEKFKVLVQDTKANHPPITNHLEHNFFLGNKKALFHNLRQYYSLIGDNAFEYLPLTFHIRDGKKDPQYKRFVEFFMKRKNQIKKEEKKAEERGTKIITRNIWIVKPGENSNQGRGITVIDEVYELDAIMKEVTGKRSQSDHKSSKAASLNSKHKHAVVEEQAKTFIVQLYIDRPFLYNNRKFDIRHYMLITNAHGLQRAYWYSEGYIRTSAYQFKINDFEPQIHLTNDAIQKHYSAYGRYEPFNKISYEELQRYLDSLPDGKQYDFRGKILPQMKKIATDSVRSVFTKISPRNLCHNFEIFGLDFMIDRDFRPWLIQINTNPCLDCECPLLARIIPYMVQQALKLSLDVVHPPPSHYPNTCRHNAPLVEMSTFKFQLIFDGKEDGKQLTELYAARGNKAKLLRDIGQIDEEEEFHEEGKQVLLDIGDT